MVVAVLGDVVVVVVLGDVVVAVVPGFGRRFGDAATDQESCGEKPECRARPGYKSQCRLLGFEHIIVPRQYCHICGKWNPRPKLRLVPFGCAMRREFDSKSDFARTEISCDSIR